MAVLALPETGARVRNAYATYLDQGDSPEKSGLTPHEDTVPHGAMSKHLWDQDGHACH